MKPAPFEYHAPRELEEAFDLLAQHGDDAKPLAGGQSLIPVLNFRLARPAVLVDLNRLESLRGIVVTDSSVQVGAMTRQSALERDASVARLVPLLADAMPHVAHPQIRNRGTLGGSIAHADPAAELPAVMLALDATFHLQSRRGARSVAASTFFTGLFGTLREPHELLVRVDIPTARPRSGFAFEEVARRHGDFALFGVAAAVRMDEGGACSHARIVGVNTANGAARLRNAEDALHGRRPDASTITAAASAAAAEVEVIGDVHAGAAYRRHLAEVLTRRALHRALSGLAPALPDR